MRLTEIHIRDPFILNIDGIFYLYGTRAVNYGMKTGGFDVYTSTNLIEWSPPIECFNSEMFGLNEGANWAPEVHMYNDEYYMFATFTKGDGLRGTYILKAISPLGPFVPHNTDAITPQSWECLDGTLYISKDKKPYLVFCHEHTQIIDGTICYVELSQDLKYPIGEVVTLFKASEPYWADITGDDVHRITDGPFMYRSESDELFMLWSTVIKDKYVECIVKFPNGEIGTEIEHLEPLITDDGGHGMIFQKGENVYITFHSPNVEGKERPVIYKVEDICPALLR